MDGQEIHGWRHLRVTQPELPDVGVGDRDRNGGLDLFDQRDQLAGGDFLAQQCLVADDHGIHQIGVGLRGAYQLLDLAARGLWVTAHPGAQQQPQPVLASQFGHCLEPLHRIGPHAAEAFGEQRQIGVDALRAQPQRLVEGGLILIERTVGRALQLAGPGQIRQRYGSALLVPEQRHGGQRQDTGKQQRQEWATGGSVHCEGSLSGARILAERQTGRQGRALSRWRQGGA